jgi:peptide/nickel transport system substrate-binding protein
MRRLIRVVAPPALLVLALAGCGGSSGGSGGGSPAATGKTLHLALSADPSPLDPDTYYEAEGLQITTAAYQGLLTYAPNSTTLVGALATKWTMSPDGKTYTFTLRPNVKFSDGTAFDAAAMQASFARRSALNGGPSYMLADVASTSAPNPLTFVVTLKNPVAPFLDYLASPYGPVAVSPAAVRTHAVGNDRAAAWLAGHSDGTGPYQLTSVVKSTKYVLTVNPNYWGPKPYYTEVDFAVVPDFSTQSLELQGGQLDMVLHGLNTRDYSSIAAQSGFQVQNFPTLFKVQAWVNPKSAVFGPMPAREALEKSLDTTALTRQIYGDRATPSTQYYPNGMLPDGAVPDTWTPSPSALGTAVSADKNAKVVIGYYGDNSLQQLADTLQVQLQHAGLSATVRPYNAAQVFALPTTPAQRPDLLLAAMNPDAAHVDTWMSVYQEAHAPVNFLGCAVPAADALAQQARNTADAAQSQALYIKAAKDYQASLCWIDIADLHDTIAAAGALTGWQHELPWVFTVDLATLKPKK